MIKKQVSFQVTVFHRTNYLSVKCLQLLFYGYKGTQMIGYVFLQMLKTKLQI